jgi:hypothetical protein
VNEAVRGGDIVPEQRMQPIHGVCVRLLRPPLRLRDDHVPALPLVIGPFAI